MATAQRVFWETVTVLVFLAIVVAAWFLSGFRAERRLAVAKRSHQQEVALQATAQEQAVRRLDVERQTEAAARAKSEAIAAFQSYAAGVQPAVAARWRRFLNTTRDQLTANPRVVFVHLTTPGGFVLTSTDEDLVASGKLDETAAWVLATDKLTTRPADDGVLQLAGPILDGGNPIAYLWLGYDVGAAEAAPAGE